MMVMPVIKEAVIAITRLIALKVKTVINEMSNVIKELVTTIMNPHVVIAA